MKPEVGKSYRTRDGQKATVVYVTVSRYTDVYPFLVVIDAAPNPSMVYWVSDFGTTPLGELYYLVEEWIDRPTMDRSVLPSWCNKTIAMDADGEWYAYDRVPQCGGNHWIRPDSVSSTNWYFIRLPKHLAPQWDGHWTDSLIIFED